MATQYIVHIAVSTIVWKTPVLICDLKLSYILLEHF